ncbi:ATP-dependent nuclease [Povalibacter sp.]|uniref:ATP-dependent nuclease n=1 Tax=Povalibacter sp. TaxID=1962978 RepID=UPI002F414FE7
MTEIRIRNFRSLEDIRIDLSNLTVLCGPNSCGKSNIFRALQLAFKNELSIEDASENLSAQKMGQGGPTLSIWVDCWFSDVPSPLQRIAAEASPDLKYSLRLTRAGNVKRMLGEHVLTPDEFRTLKEHFVTVYVPPIRDLSADGLQPFKRLLKTALQKARGMGSIRGLGDQAKRVLTNRATVLLQQQHQVATRILGAERLSLDTSQIEIESLYDNIGLTVRIAGADIPLNALGTGHQSAVIMNLYRQLGEAMEASVLYMFEEPDNHLHPTTIRSICDDLTAIAKQSQVLVSTHSPVFLGHTGLHPIRPLSSHAGITKRRKVTVFKHYSEKQARAHLDTYGLRLTEPLLTNRVLIVEGQSDKIVLSTLFEMRFRRTVDQADLLVIPAGGKDRVVALAHLISCLGVEWKCVMDNDAMFSAETPYGRGLQGDERSQALATIDIVQGYLDGQTKRGANASKLLAAVRSEVEHGPATRTLYDNSALRRLVEQTALLSSAEQDQLRTSLRAARRREIGRLLSKANSFIWSGTIEEVLLRNEGTMACVEDVLLAEGKLKNALGGHPQRRATLINKLHGSANEPTVLREVVLALEDGGHFRRSEVNECFGSIFSGLQ